MVSAYLQLLVIVLINAVGQLMFKTGSEALSSFDQLLTSPLSIFQHPSFLFGGVLYATSLVLYVNVLSRVRLSTAYPFLALTYIVVVFLSAVVLDEPIGTRTVVGALLIFVGVSLVGSGLEA